MPGEKSGLHVFDSLKSLLSGLGDLTRDKAAGASYDANNLNDVELLNAYEGSWIAEKLVDIPAQDSFRKWRTWQAEAGQVEKIEKLEAKLGLQAKMLQCKTRARLYGGAALFIGTAEENYSEPLDPENIGKDGLKFLNVFSRRELTAGQLEDDPTSERYGLPRDYEVSGTETQSKIHPSRLVVQIGKEHPCPFEVGGPSHGWGKSVLCAVYDAVRNADSTAGNIASLIFEANVDVIGVPDLMTSLANSKYEQRVMNRFALAAAGKSINRTLIHDSKETYDRKQITFSALPDLLEKFLLIVSGAADIPMTRFFGQSPSGLSSTGEGDMKNYHDKISSMQELEIGPAMEVLDECLIRSALGNRPDEISYEWRPLEQMSEKEIAEIGKTTAETANTLAVSGLYTDEELRKVTTNQLVENNVFPGLAAVVAETDAGGGFSFEEEEGISATDARPRTLYAYRPVVNAKDIFEWAKGQGLETVTAPEEMHVTIAWSKKELDWLSIGETYSDEITVKSGGARLIEEFGEGAIVLGFRCNELNWRHHEILNAGGESSHDEYNAHITLTWNRGAKNIDEIEPYRGEIILGAEVFEEIDPDWKSKIRER